MPLRIDIKGHINDLKAKVGAARNSIKSFAGNVKAMLGGVATAFASAFAVRAIIGRIRSLANEMDQLGKSARAMGIGVEKWQEMTFAAKIAGVEVNQLTKAMGSMASFMLAAAKSGSTNDKVLKALGLSYKEISRLKPDELFKRITTAIDNMTSAQDRMATSKAIFGRSGIDILNMARGYDDAVDLIRSKGGIMSQEDIAAAERFNDELALTEKRGKAAASRSGIMQFLADAMGDVNKHPLKLAEDLMKTGGHGGKVMRELFGNQDARSAEEVKKRFGEGVSSEDRARAKKARDEASSVLRKALDDATNTGAGGGKDRFRVDQLRRIGALPGANNFAAKENVQDTLMRYLPMVLEAADAINRKTPEINEGGRY